MHGFRGIILGLCLIFWSVPSNAFENYDACIASIGQNAERTVERADQWARLDGGWPARHCRALALIAVGAKQSGAIELTRIGAEATELPGQARSEIFALAGETFLDVDEIGEAEQSLDRALNLAKDPRPALQLSARLNERRGNAAAAVRDLDKAIKHGPITADLLILRSSARQRAGDLVGARDDAIRAQELSPDDPDVWYQNGQIQALLGNVDAARDAWLRTIDLARGEPLAKAAQISLQKLEAGR